MHSLNLVVQDAMTLEQDLTGIKERCKNIISHFHRSVKSSDKLVAIQKATGSTGAQAYSGGLY